MKKIKFTFAVKFALIVLTIIIINACILSSVFLLNLYSVNSNLGRVNVEKSVENLRDDIVSLLDKYIDMIDVAGYEIGSVFNQGLINPNELSEYLEFLLSKMPEIEILYFASNTNWNLPGGYLITSSEWTPDEDWDQTKRPWFLNAKEAGGAIVFSDPFVDVVTGGVVISLSKIVYDRQGRDIGVVSADMLVTNLNTKIHQTLVFDEQIIYLLNNDGLYITNPLPYMVMTNNFFEENYLEHYLEHVFSNNTFHSYGKNYNFFSAIIPQAGWYLVSITPNTIIFAESNRIRNNIILLSLIISIVAAVISALFTYYFLNRPIQNMLNIFSHLNNNNLNVRLQTNSNDELGDLTKALSGFLINLQNTFITFSNNANLVSTAVLELSSSAQEISTTANEQSASVSEIVSTMENNKDLAAQAAGKTTKAADLAAHIQEMSRRGADLHDFNENMMLDIRNQNAKIIDIIKNLADMLSKIDESIILIDTIADHTKLIAFNAALEASSSGEAGSRFSVVASEIRRFADNVVESASEIKEKIAELQDASQTLISEANSGTRAIDAGYKRMVEQKEVFENIAGVSKNVAVHSQEISGLSKQQEMASAQVFSALKEISSGVSQFVSVTGMTSAAVKRLSNMAEDLKETLSKYNVSDKIE